MSLEGIESIVLWELAPSSSRIDEIDSTLRLRLAHSFEYLKGLPWLDVGEDAVLRVIERLKAGPVSPWVFCLYSRLVTELSKGPEGTEESLAALVQAASLAAGDGVIALRDCTIPNPWWDHFQLLLDTDQAPPFRPCAPTPQHFTRCKQELHAGLELMRRIDPIWHDEVKKLLRSTVLGSPAKSDPG